MARFRNRPPLWFRVVAVLLVLWGVAGVLAFYLDVRTTPAQLAQMPAYDRALLLSRPGWFLWLYGISVWSGLTGAIMLLLRRRHAQPLFVVSLVTVALMFGYILAWTDLIAVKGFGAAAGFPILIVAIAAFQIWLAARARRRGWIA